MNAEFNGSWVRKGAVMVPVPSDEPEPVARKPRKILFDWDDEQLKAAHAGFWRGDRDLWTREGERVYNSRRRATQRQRMSATDRQWCQRQAIKWSWILDERTHRSARMTNVST